MIAAHCRIGGHRGIDVTENKVKAEFIWHDLKKDVREFVQKCLHCIITRNGERIPKPLATVLDSQWPNEVIHMDFLYMGPTEKTNLKYVLLLKDDLTSYSWLMPFQNQDSEAAVSALSKWIAAFGKMDWLVSDRGPHFTASVIQQGTEEYRVQHHLSTPY